MGKDDLKDYFVYVFDKKLYSDLEKEFEKANTTIQTEAP